MASSRSSGLKTTDSAIAEGRNRLNAITVRTDGTNDATVVLYDNTSATGTVLAKITCKGAEHSLTVNWTNPVLTELGIYADVTGTNAEYIVYYGG